VLPALFCFHPQGNRERLLFYPFFPFLRNDGYSQNGTAWANTTLKEPHLGAVAAYNTPPKSYSQIGANQNTCQSYANASTGHTGVILAGLGDGTVKMIAQGMSATTYDLALIPNDGTPLPSDW
jgi:hypothetical protein